ncbi:MAG TPA: hypothetical protein VF752_01090 [Thermoleophilaceae bacterium]
MLERQRAGPNGASDLSIDVWRSRGRELNLRMPFPGLEQNPDDGGRRRWPMLDSLGRTLALLEQDADGLVTTDPETGREIHRERTGRLSLQGRGAMADGALESSQALVAFDARDRSELAPGASIVPFRIRAFVSRDALPRRVGFSRVRAKVDTARTDRGECDLTPLSRVPLQDPGFRSDERFVGEDGRARTYATYSAKRPYGGAMYICVNTTGVHGGGIVRAVAREGDEVDVLDELPEPDSNAASGTPLACWRFLRLAGTSICGWVPARAG